MTYNNKDNPPKRPGEYLKSPESYEKIFGPSYEKWKAENPYNETNLYEPNNAFYTSETAWKIIHGEMPEDEAARYVRDLYRSNAFWLNNDAGHDIRLEKKLRGTDELKHLAVNCPDFTGLLPLDYIYATIEENCEYGFTKNGKLIYTSWVHNRPESEDELVIECHFPIDPRHAAVTATVNYGDIENTVDLSDDEMQKIKHFLQEQFFIIEERVRRTGENILNTENDENEKERRIYILREGHPLRKLILSIIDKYSGYNASFAWRYFPYLEDKLGGLNADELPRAESMSDYYFGEKLNAKADIEELLADITMLYGEEQTIKLLKVFYLESSCTYDLVKLWKENQLHHYRKQERTIRLEWIYMILKRYGFDESAVSLHFYKDTFPNDEFESYRLR